MIPHFDLDGARQAHVRLLADLNGLTDSRARAASLLPGWSVGHVLTHLARNADGQTAMFEAAAQGRIADQYPGGAQQRFDDIEAGAGRPAADLIADLRAACARLDEVWHHTDDATWALGHGRLLKGQRALTEIVFLRWREVEVHHADLGLGFSWRDWSDDYVDTELDHTAGGLAARLPDEIAVRLEPTDAVGVWIVETVPRERIVLRAPRHELLAWLVGRHDRPDWPTLAPW